MFNRIRNWFVNHRFQKRVDSTLKLIKTPHSTNAHIWHNPEQETALIFTAGNGDDIFSISQDGEAKWLKEDSYNEAAEMFLTHMTMTIEDRAGIAQNRVEWEERITAKLTEQAELAPLGPEELTDVIRKCIMYDKLKGIKN